MGEDDGGSNSRHRQQTARRHRTRRGRGTKSRSEPVLWQIWSIVYDKPHLSPERRAPLGFARGESSWYPEHSGETGYQPVIFPNGEWRYDELTGFSLIERKWAYGFAG